MYGWSEDMKYLSKLLYSYLSEATSGALKELPKCSSLIRSRSSRRSHTVGFLVGVSTGVGIALLLAPKSGAATRSTIVKKARETSGYLKQQASELSGSVTEAVGIARRATETAV
jgi:hypothetical protein